MSDEASKKAREIAEVMREEKARGRRHMDTDAQEEQRQLRSDYLRLAKEIDDEEDFLRAISGLELTLEQTQTVLAAWRELKQSQR